MKKVFVTWLSLALWHAGAAIGAPQVGWWWNPNESGRGFFVESQNGATFIGAYFYDDDGHATWLVAGGQNADSYNYTGPLYALNNGQTLFGSYVAPAGPETVGQMSVHFSDDTHGTLTWPGGTVAIERQIFGAGNAPFQPFNGWWWNPDESGSGYSLELQGDKLFIVGFMYDDGGRPVWYFSAGPMSSPTTYHSDVLQFANGQTMGGPYHPPSGYSTIATLDVEFTAADEATLTFTEAAGASVLPRKAGRSRTDFVRPQLPKEPIYIPPKAFTGLLTVDQKVHIDKGDGFVDDIHYVHRFAMTLSTRDNGAGSFAYGDLEGELEAVYDSFDAGPQYTCTGHGERTQSLSGMGVDGLVFILSANNSQHYSLIGTLVEGKFDVAVNTRCTSPDGTVTLIQSTASPGTGFIDHEGPIVGDSINFSAIKTVGPSDGLTSTVTYYWSFTAVR